MSKTICTKLECCPDLFFTMDDDPNCHSANDYLDKFADILTEFQETLEEDFNNIVDTVDPDSIDEEYYTRYDDFDTVPLPEQKKQIADFLQKYNVKPHLYYGCDDNYGNRGLCIKDEYDEHCCVYNEMINDRLIDAAFVN